MKRIAFSLACAGLFVLACSKPVIKDKPKQVTKETPKEMPKAARYSESVDAVLVAENSSKLVLIGPGHHYVFDCPPVLAMTMDSLRHAAWAPATDKKLKLAADGSVVLAVQLSVDRRKLGEDQVLKAAQSGYQNLGGFFLGAKFDLKGMRYDGGGLELPKNIRLKHSITVEGEAFPAGMKARDATPVAFPVGKALTLGSLILIVPSEAAVDVVRGLLGPDGIGSGPKAKLEPPLK